MKTRHIRFHADEFISGVVGMKPFDVGVYWVICSLIYSTGGPIPENDERIFRTLKARKDDVRRSIDGLVAALKLSRNCPETVPKLSSKRCEMELERSRNRSETAMKGGAQKSKNNGLHKKEYVTTDMLTTNPKPVTLSPDKLDVEVTLPNGVILAINPWGGVDEVFAPKGTPQTRMGSDEALRLRAEVLASKKPLTMAG